MYSIHHMPSWVIHDYQVPAIVDWLGRCNRSDCLECGASRIAAGDKCGGEVEAQCLKTPAASHKIITAYCQYTISENVKVLLTLRSPHRRHLHRPSMKHFGLPQELPSSFAPCSSFHPSLPISPPSSFHCSMLSRCWRSS